jgi:uncharacterized protein
MMRWLALQKKIVTFLALTLMGSAVFYYLIISSGSLESMGGLWVLLLMWTPGLAGIITQLFYEHSLRGMGWKPGKVKYLLLAYVIPLLYCLVVYGLTWVSGLGLFPSPEFMEKLRTAFGAQMSDTLLILTFVARMGTLGVLVSMLSALGEEIGWRGLLVPELAKVTSFQKTALISGAIWADWHLPLILFSDYNMPGIPKWYATIMFIITVMGISFAFAWLRLKSGSLWTAALLHASHNLFVQSIFTPLTGMTPVTPYIIDEFGIGLALAAVVLMVVFWRKAVNMPEA